jgi:adenylylsulfate kinase
MSTAASETSAFAIWITGLPASGKSAVTSAVIQELRTLGIDAVVLESDALRRQFSSDPSYDTQDRDYFYASMAFIGEVLTQHGVPVIFDATANRRAYRDRARSGIPRFLEIYIDSPLEVCMKRDPKGIYRKALSGESHHVPGVQAEYEAPLKPDLVVHGDREAPESSATRIVDALVSRGWVSSSRTLSS